MRQKITEVLREEEYLFNLHLRKRTAPTAVQRMIWGTKRERRHRNQCSYPPGEDSDLEKDNVSGDEEK